MVRLSMLCQRIQYLSDAVPQLQSQDLGTLQNTHVTKQAKESHWKKNKQQKLDEKINKTQTTI